MWVPATESRAEIVELHHFSAKHSDETIESLPLDAPGVVPWWSEEKKNVTLHRILVHMCVETARHAGQADIIREPMDGSIGQRPDDPNIPGRTTEEWAMHRDRIEQAALEADHRRE